VSGVGFSPSFLTFAGGKPNDVIKNSVKTSLKIQYDQIFYHLSQKAFKDHDTILILTKNRAQLTPKDKDIFKILTANVSDSPEANIYINYLYQQMPNVFEPQERDAVKRTLFEIAIRGDLTQHKSLLIDNLGTHEDRQNFLKLKKADILKVFPQLGNITTDYVPGRLQRLSQIMGKNLRKNDKLAIEHLVMQYAKSVFEKKNEISADEIQRALSVLSQTDFAQSPEIETFYALLTLNRTPVKEFEYFNIVVNGVTEKLASLANKTFIQGPHYLLSDEIFSFIQKTAAEGIFSRNLQLSALYFLKNGSLSIHANKEGYIKTLRLFLDNPATEPEVHRFLLGHYRNNTAYSRAIELALPHMDQQNISKLRKILNHPSNQDISSVEYKRLKLAVSRFPLYTSLCLKYNSLLASTKKLLGRK
jgi:hypothetical protein